MGKIDTSININQIKNNDTLPILLNPSDRSQSKLLAALLKKVSKNHVIDSLADQFDELFYIMHPQLKKSDSNSIEIQNFIHSYIGDKTLFEYGVWMYYPWNTYLVHFLPEKLHLLIRTARNRNLITENEQNTYYNSTVGIAGLSIGNSVVGTLLHTGGTKYMRLADFDRLSATNINRMRTSFTHIGMKKTEIACQEIYEVNPYADLTVYPDGLRKDLLEKFLCKPNKIDILVEEMDNIYLKIQIRLLARKHRIPVIMATDNGDNIILDIERYDLDPKYPLFHGDIKESELMKITPETEKFIAATLITRWVHPDNVALAMQKSLLELGKTLYSWPQLGTAALLSGCAVSYAYRNIILGNKIVSGKYLVSFDNSILKLNEDTSYKKEFAIHTQQFINMLHL
jgi:tRNA threonylcarbamoyladenosine dehydratase